MLNAIWSKSNSVEHVKCGFSVSIFSHQSGLAAIFFLHALIHYYTLLSKEVNHIFVVIQYGAIQHQYYTHYPVVDLSRLKSYTENKDKNKR